MHSTLERMRLNKKERPVGATASHHPLQPSRCSPAYRTPLPSPRLPAGWEAVGAELQAKHDEHKAALDSHLKNRTRASQFILMFEEAMRSEGVLRSLARQHTSGTSTARHAPPPAPAQRATRRCQHSAPRAAARLQHSASRAAAASTAPTLARALFLTPTPNPSPKPTLQP